MTEEVKIKEPDQILYLGSKYARPTTVFGWMKGVVFDSGGEMVRKDLFNKMLTEFKPNKSDKFGPGYVQAYIRGSIQLGYLTPKSDNRATDLGAAPEKPEKPAKAPKAAGSGEEKVTVSGQALLDQLKSITSDKDFAKGRFTSDVATLADLTKKPAKAVAKSVAKLEKDGFLVTEVEGDITRVKFTQAGWDLAIMPPEEEVAPPAA